MITKLVIEFLFDLDIGFVLERVFRQELEVVLELLGVDSGLASIIYQNSLLDMLVKVVVIQ